MKFVFLSIIALCVGCNGSVHLGIHRKVESGSTIGSQFASGVEIPDINVPDEVIKELPKDAFNVKMLGNNWYTFELNSINNPIENKIFLYNYLTKSVTPLD